MSDAQLDLREQIIRIDRAIAETQKLAAEQRKLDAEARKFNRDPWFLLLGAALAFIGTVAARLPEILRGLGSAP